MKVTFAFFFLVGLSLTSGLLTVLLYERFTGGSVVATADAVAAPPPIAVKPASSAAPPAPKEKPKPASAMLDAPAIKQYPELPSGCEVTSLTMLLQYAGVNKSKTELAYEMPKDPTPLRTDGNGGFISWGDPNVGFVGDVTGKSRGFGIYHAGLLPLLKTYEPEALDLTGKPFDMLERQVAEGYPVIVWNTADYSVPNLWVTWDSPNGAIRTTFAEHAVLLVGYDDANVYVNDPITGGKNVSIAKAQFLEAWKAMGQQALSYKKATK